MSLSVFGDCLPAYDMNNEIRLDSLACSSLSTLTRGLLRFTATQCKRKQFKATPNPCYLGASSPVILVD